MIEYEVDQPWVVYHYGRTHDRWYLLDELDDLT